MNNGPDKLKIGVNSDFEVKFDLEGQGQLPPKTRGTLTKVFCIFGPNLAILAWTGPELSRGQASDWHTDGQTDRQTDRQTHTHTQTQATTTPEGQNWPWVKMINNGIYFNLDSTQIRSLSRGKQKTLIGLVITRVASRHKESSRLRLREKRIQGVPGKKAHHLRPEDIANKIPKVWFITRYYDICECSV